jgi:hypothetical protein
MRLERFVRPARRTMSYLLALHAEEHCSSAYQLKSGQSHLKMRRDINVGIIWATRSIYIYLNNLHEQGEYVSRVEHDRSLT